DYFVNHVWGRDGIDYHFAPSRAVKMHLIGKGVPPSRIFVTGIPVHPALFEKTDSQPLSDGISVLVTGGNLGVGMIDKFPPVTRTDIPSDKGWLSVLVTGGNLGVGMIDRLLPDKKASAN